MKEQKTNGLTSNLELKKSLSKLPIFGDFYFKGLKLEGDKFMLKYI